MEAGIGTLARMGDGALDVVLLVVNPSEKSIEVARRAREIILSRKIAGNSLVVANRLRDGTDLELLREALASAEMVAVPEDPEVRHADIRGMSPVDSVPTPPAVEAIGVLGRSLVASD